MSVARSGQRDVGGEEGGAGAESEAGGGGGEATADGVPAHAVVSPLRVREVWQLGMSRTRSGERERERFYFPYNSCIGLA